MLTLPAHGVTCLISNSASGHFSFRTAAPLGLHLFGSNLGPGPLALAKGMHGPLGREKP